MFAEFLNETVNAFGNLGGLFLVVISLITFTLIFMEAE